MIDDVLRADAARWNARQGPVPDLDEAINTLDRRARTPRSRRMVLSGLAAASVVAAAAAVVVISADGGQSRDVAGGGPAGSSGAVVVTHTVVRPVTVTRTNNVTTTVVRAQAGLGTRPVVSAVTETAHATVTRLLTRSVIVGSDVAGSDVAGTHGPGTTSAQRVDLAVTKARPVVGHTRALLASIGLFVAIAGAWGLGRAQRRRSH